MELICSLGHQYTPIFPSNMFSEGLSPKGTFALKRDHRLLKSVLHFVPKFQVSCLTTLSGAAKHLCPGFWVVIEARDLQALFTNFCPGKALRFKLTSLFLSYSRPMFLHIVIENTGMEEI